MSDQKKKKREDKHIETKNMLTYINYFIIILKLKADKSGGKSSSGTIYYI